MSAYQRPDDGIVDAAEMVEVRPHVFVRRDVALGLGLVSPSFGLGRSRPAVGPAATPRPAAPPLQPSHADLSSIGPEPVPEIPGPPLAAEPATVVVGTPRSARPRPPKRSIADILAEAARNHRAMRGRVKA